MPRRSAPPLSPINHSPLPFVLRRVHRRLYPICQLSARARSYRHSRRDFTRVRDKYNKSQAMCTHVISDTCSQPQTGCSNFARENAEIASSNPRERSPGRSPSSGRRVFRFCRISSRGPRAHCGSATSACADAHGIISTRRGIVGTCHGLPPAPPSSSSCLPPALTCRPKEKVEKKREKKRREEMKENGVTKVV